jgi:arylsulfatase A-like enzyme
MPTHQGQPGEGLPNQSAQPGGGDASTAPLQPPDASKVDYGSAFWLTYWLAVVLCLAKLIDMGLPRSSAAAHWRFAVDFAAVTFRDLLFALAIGLSGQAVLLVFSKTKRVQRVAWFALAAICGFLVLYAIVSVRIYSYLHAFLTYSLIYVAGDFSNMRSSLGVFITGPFTLILIGGPVLYFVLVRECSRRIGVPRGASMAVVSALFAAILVSQAVYSEHAYWTWFKSADHVIYENPHWLMVRSLTNEICGTGGVNLRGQYPPAYANDFMTASEAPQTRPSSPNSAPTVIVQTQTPYKPPKNVIVFVLESTPTQHLSLYGSPFKTTPRLEAEAAHSLVYDNLYSQDGMTASSLVSLTLSRYPEITFRQGTQEHPDMPGTSLAQVLHARGFRTAFITSADIDFSGQDKFLAHRGYDKIADWRTLPGPKLFSWGAADSALVDSILGWIDQKKGAPFFVTGWTTQTHHPYQLSPGQTEVDFCHGKLPVEGEGLNLYMNCIAEDDRQIGRLIDGLRERGLADDTLIVITGDHGEAFRWPHDTSGHGFLCYQECVNVPCIFWNPRLFSPGQRIHTVGGHIDLNPSILDILAIPSPSDWQGRSLFQHYHEERAYFFAASHDYMLGVREEQFKYVYDASVGAEELYDLRADPLEQKNIADLQQQRCTVLRGRLMAWLDYEQKHEGESPLAATAAR